MGTHKGLLHHMNINVSDVKKSLRFYGPMFTYLGYELDRSDDSGEDWKRWDQDTPHEFSIMQANMTLQAQQIVRGGVGRFDHIAFCALDNADVDRFHAEILVPLAAAGLCTIEDAPCACPEYGEGYYATFFADPDGLRYEFVNTERFLQKKKDRQAQMAAE